MQMHHVPSYFAKILKTDAAINTMIAALCLPTNCRCFIRSSVVMCQEYIAGGMASTANVLLIILSSKETAPKLKREIASHIVTSARFSGSFRSFFSQAVSGFVVRILRGISPHIITISSVYAPSLVSASCPTISSCDTDRTFNSSLLIELDKPNFVSCAYFFHKRL